MANKDTGTLSSTVSSQEIVKTILYMNLIYSKACSTISILNQRILNS